MSRSCEVLNMPELLNSVRGPNEWADTYGDLGTVASMELAILPLNILDPWVSPSGRPQPFKPYSIEKLLDLAESIRKNDVIEPICVRPMPGNRFQIVAGHNRVEGSKLSGRTTIPAVIRQLSDEQATILMVESNFKHREKLLPSEIAYGYLELMEAIKREKKRHAGRPLKNYSQCENNFQEGAEGDPNNYSHSENNFQDGAEDGSNNYSHGENNFQGTTTSGELAALKGVSKASIFRYIRLTELITPLLDMVDNGKFAFMAAVETSYLNKDAQALLLSIMKTEPCKAPSLAQAKQLRMIYDAGKLDEDAILAILVKPTGAQEPEIKLSLPTHRFGRFFGPALSQAEILTTIEAALEMYEKHGKEKKKDA